MKISTYSRPLKNGMSKVYVRYTVNGVDKRKATEIVLFDNPKDKVEREHNKNAKILEKTLVSQLTLKIQKNELGLKSPKHKTKDFIEYFALLTQQRENSEKNYQTWKSALKHLKEFSPNGLRFVDLDVHWLEDFKHFIVSTQKLKSSSCANYFNVVLHGVHDAFRDRMIDIDYAEYVNAPQIEHPIRVYLTEEELLKLEETECKNPLLKIAFLFACITGMSFADIKNLEWQHIKKDHENNYFIAFHRQKTKGLQYLPITKDARDMLGDEGEADDKIFKKLKYNSWMNLLIREWVNEAGIHKKISFHNARHTYATLLLHKGANITYVSKLLGHKDLKTTMIYAKVMDEDLRNTAELIKFNKKQPNE